MAFIVELEDGREIEFDRKPTPDDVDFAVGQLDTPKPQPLGLPGFQETEERISSRTGGFEGAQQAFERIRQDPLSVFATPGQTSPVADILLSPLTEVFQRGEAAIANPALAVQERAAPQEVLGEVGRGLSGERLGRFEDIPSRALPQNKFTRAASAVIGFAPFAATGMLGAGNKLRQLDRLSKASKVVQKNTKFRPIAQGLADDLASIKKGVMTQNNKVANSVKDIVATTKEISQAKKIIKRLPNNVRTAINNSDKTILESLQSKTPTLTVGQLRTIKTHIGDKAFILTKKGRQNKELINLFNESKGLSQKATARELVKSKTFKNVDEALAALKDSDDAMTSFYKVEQDMNRLVFQGGDPRKGVTSTKLKGLVRNEDSLSTLNRFVQNYSDKSAKAMFELFKLERQRKQALFGQRVGERAIEAGLITGGFLGINALRNP